MPSSTAGGCTHQGHGGLDDDAAVDHVLAEGGHAGAGGDREVAEEGHEQQEALV